MAKAKPRTGDRHAGTAKTIRFTDEQAARLEAAKDRLGGTYAEVIDGALRALEGRNDLSKTDVLAYLQRSLPADTVKLTRGVKVEG